MGAGHGRRPGANAGFGAVYDDAYAGLLFERDAETGNHTSIHATGYSFDIGRRYGSGAQAEAFQYTLERLESLGLIAWMRSTRVIHITVSLCAAVRPVPLGRS